jgi:hypothetical protein
MRIKKRFECRCGRQQILKTTKIFQFNKPFSSGVFSDVTAQALERQCLTFLSTEPRLRFAPDFRLPAARGLEFLSLLTLLCQRGLSRNRLAIFTAHLSISRARFAAKSCPSLGLSSHQGVRRSPRPKRPQFFQGTPASRTSFQPPCSATSSRFPIGTKLPLSADLERDESDNSVIYFLLESEDSCIDSAGSSNARQLLMNPLALKCSTQEKF